MTDEIVEFGLKTLKIKKLKLPGDWSKILSSPHALEQAESIAEVGLIHYPTVRRSDKLLICGCHRVAGLSIRGETDVRARVIECSDELVEAMRSHENSERTHDVAAKQRARDARKRRLAALTEEVAKEVAKKGPVLDEGGRARSIAAVAQERHAEELGLKKQTLYQQQWRERKRAEEAKRRDDLLRKSPINDRGMEMDDEFFMQLAIVKKRTEDARGRLTSAANSLVSLKRQGLPFSDAVLERLCDDLKTVSAAIGGEAPTTLCPWCRAIAGVVESCNDCNCTGWMGTRGLEDSGDIPHELLDDEEPAVMFRGGIMTVEDYLRIHGGEEDPSDEEDEVAALWR